MKSERLMDCSKHLEILFSSLKVSSLSCWVADSPKGSSPETRRAVAGTTVFQIQLYIHIDILKQNNKPNAYEELKKSFNHKEKKHILKKMAYVWQTEK